ncbi:hypothetical protein [Lacticaseibacillus jixiensis]|uniref:hypothetical protein n=1 Tax=Lacticaseibacillus jixiensis TaxID=3231926 RepID=UPI0036F230D2
MKKLNKGWLAGLVLLAATLSVLLLAGCGDTAADSGDADEETAEYYTADDESVDDAATESSETTASSFSQSSDATTASSVSQSTTDDQAAASAADSTAAASQSTGTTDQYQDPRPAQASSTTRNYQYQPVPQTGQQETVYINTAIKGRYHKDPNCRGLQRFGGGTPMTLAQAQQQGYTAFCAYERYGDN